MTKIYRALMEGREIADNLTLADTFFSRLKGLSKHHRLDEGEGLIIRPCSQIHTIGMKFAIDVVFLTKSGVVIQFEQDMHPGDVSGYVHRAWQVVELKSGTIAAKDISIGRTITFEYL
ncbi:MAG: DUF192 domain-containing protein [Saccharofermentanales bacterium]